MVKFNNKSEPNTKEGKDKKQNTFDSVSALYKGRKLTLNAFTSRTFPIKATQEKGRPGMLPLRPSDVAPVPKFSDRTRLKILTPKKMLQRLPIALALVKAGNTSVNLLNEIRKTIYSLY